MNKKERERRQREIANEESRARAESQDRQERIKELWDLEERTLKAKTAEERELKEKTLKWQKLKKLQSDFVRNLPANLFESEKPDLIDRVSDLVQLAGLQDREINYLTQFRDHWERIRRHFPVELKNLSTRSFFAEVGKLVPGIFAGLPKKPSPKQESEAKRRRTWCGTGLIQWEFGGALETWLRTRPLLGVTPDLVPWFTEPTCLDDIFSGGGVNMTRLEDLFGIDDHRFPPELPSFKDGVKRWYDYRAVVKIMRFLLRERALTKRKGPGRSKVLWLSDPNVRTRVLNGIEARINSFECPEQIRREFLDVLAPSPA